MSSAGAFAKMLRPGTSSARISCVPRQSRHNDNLLKVSYLCRTMANSSKSIHTGRSAEGQKEQQQQQIAETGQRDTISKAMAAYLQRAKEHRKYIIRNCNVSINIEFFDDPESAKNNNMHIVLCV
jgi:hypothetical protein